MGKSKLTKELDFLKKCKKGLPSVRYVNLLEDIFGDILTDRDFPLYSEFGSGQRVSLDEFYELVYTKRNRKDSLEVYTSLIDRRIKYIEEKLN